MNKTHGQHLLKNPLILQALVEKSELKNTDTVLEIGPGTGNLTMLLLQQVKKVCISVLEFKNNLLLPMIGYCDRT